MIVSYSVLRIAAGMALTKASHAIMVFMFID
jgi:hypothetical protein